MPVEEGTCLWFNGLLTNWTVFTALANNKFFFFHSLSLETGELMTDQTSVHQPLEDLTMLAKILTISHSNPIHLKQTIYIEIPLLMTLDIMYSSIGCALIFHLFSCFNKGIRIKPQILNLYYHSLAHIHTWQPICFSEFLTIFNDFRNYSMWKLTKYNKSCVVFQKYLSFLYYSTEIILSNFNQSVLGMILILKLLTHIC